MNRGSEFEQRVQVVFLMHTVLPILYRESKLLPIEKAHLPDRKQGIASRVFLTV